VVTVSCTVTNGAGQSGTPGSNTVSFVAAPVATITAPGPVVALSTGNPASVPVQSGSTYAWSILDGTIETATDGPSITYTAGGDLGPVSLTCVVTNSAGTPASDTANVTITGGVAGSITLSVSDASTEDWATIGVRILGVQLVPRSGAPVPVYTAPVPAPRINLAQLDQLSELLADLPVPAGTYTGAVLTLGGNPDDVTLVSSADPSAGFPDRPATRIPAARIQVLGTTGAAGQLTVPVAVPFASNLVVAAGQRGQLDLEFVLSHPAFLVDHLAAGDAAPLWAVNFSGAVRQQAAAGTSRVLRHLYGRVTAAGSSALTLEQVYPAQPATHPETAQATSHALRILADGSRGTQFTDRVDGTGATLDDFSTVAGALPGRFVRIAARFQADGTLVAARIWAGDAFDAVYAGAEGHVLHVDPVAGTLIVADPDGARVAVRVTPATRFFFRAPGDAQLDAAPIGTGPGFLGTGLVRGFKVHASIDPGTTPATASSVDIEAARFDGQFSSLTAQGLTCRRSFATAADDYTVALAFSAAGALPAGAAAFKVQAARAGAGAGEAAGPDRVPWGVSYATWNDPAQPAGWSARDASLEPTAFAGRVASPWTGSGFGLSLDAGSVTVTVDASTQVYRVERTGTRLALHPVELASASGQAALAADLASGAAVKVHAIPQADHSLKAAALFTYIGAQPR
jgi:hypothetical protein